MELHEKPWKATTDPRVMIREIVAYGGMADGIVGFDAKYTRPLRPGGMRCNACGGDYAPNKDGGMRIHRCEPGADRQWINAGRFATRAAAIAVGIAMATDVPEPKKRRK